MSWETRTVADLCSVITDCPHSTPKWTDEGVRVLRSKNIRGGRLNLDAQVSFTSEIEYEKRTRRAVPQFGDLVITREAPMGEICMLPNIKCCLGQRMVLLRPDATRAEPHYLLYAFQSHNVQGQIKRSEGTGTTVSNLRIPHLAALDIPYPPIEQQRHIAKILAAYDDLVENNRRRIHLLEQAARLLYKEWFVHLRFPGHEHVTITNGVPEGWEKKHLCEIATINDENLAKTFEGDIAYIDIAAVSPGHVAYTTKYDFKDAPSRARRVVQHEDLIWSCVRPNRKSYAVIWDPSPGLIASTGFAVIRPRTVPVSFLEQATTTPEFVGYLENNAKGVAYPAVVQSDFARAEILVPPQTFLRQFNMVVGPILQQRSVLENAMRELEKARDLLLPRLMNGEIAA